MFHPTLKGHFPCKFPQFTHVLKIWLKAPTDDKNESSSLLGLFFPPTFPPFLLFFFFSNVFVNSPGCCPSQSPYYQIKITEYGKANKKGKEGDCDKATSWTKPPGKKKTPWTRIRGGAHLGALVHGTLNPPDPLHPHAAFWIRVLKKMHSDASLQLYEICQICSI